MLPDVVGLDNLTADVVSRKANDWGCGWVAVAWAVSPRR
jgi:hypothetical protein